MTGAKAGPGLFGDSLRVILAEMGHATEDLSSQQPPGAWLRGHVLFLDIGWFTFTRDGVVRKSIMTGQPIVRIRPPPPEAAPILTAWPARDEMHHGVRLWDICLYELCIKHDCSVEELERRVDQSPGPDEAAAETIQSAKWLVDWAVGAIEFYQPRVVMFPQGYVLSAAAIRAVARARGLPVVALENTFRSDRICWDDISGITLASPIPMRTFKERRTTGADAYFQQYREASRALKTHDHTTAGAGAPPEFGGRKILFIGQVNTDSSVLFHIGRGFSDQLEAVNAVADYTVRSPTSLLLLKVHPKEVRGLNPLQEPYSLERYERFRQRDGVAGCDRVVIDDAAELDIMDAIDWADLCVTINSQAGLEAAAMGKPVILCGDASYDRLRSVRKVESPEQLMAALNDPSPPIDATEAREFFRAYCEDYCKPAQVKSLITLAGSSRPRRGVRWTSIWALLWMRTAYRRAKGRKSSA